MPEKITQKINDMFSYEIYAEPGQPTRGILKVNSTTFLIQLTDGKTIVAFEIPGPGDIHYFAKRLELWATNLIVNPLPTVESEVYKDLGLQAELQFCSNDFVEAVRFGIDNFGMNSKQYLKLLWEEFSSKHLDRYAYSDNPEGWKNLGRSFRDALWAALRKYHREQVLRF